MNDDVTQDMRDYAAFHLRHYATHLDAIAHTLATITICGHEPNPNRDPDLAMISAIQHGLRELAAKVETP